MAVNSSMTTLWPPSWKGVVPLTQPAHYLPHCCPHCHRHLPASELLPFLLSPPPLPPPACHHHVLRLIAVLEQTLRSWVSTGAPLHATLPHSTPPPRCHLHASHTHTTPPPPDR